MVSLYFHIPYCRKKCPYCHFFVLQPTQIQEFHQALIKEWQAKRPLIENQTITSIYFGGGTPSLLDPALISQLLDLTGRHGEITLEMNPEDVTLDRVKEYKNLGINRLSLGVQSFDNTTLKQLGRSHTAIEAQKALNICYTGGFDNITIDLMYDLPYQTLTSWKQTLAISRKLPIAHVSLYNLTFEAPSYFHRKKKSLTPHLPSDPDSLKMLEMAIETFEDIGLKRYEISAFGRMSVHNTGYWTARPFLGLGPSAFSYWEGSRFRNIANLAKYIQNQAIDFKETLTPQAQQRERLAIGLRILSGVNLEDFELPDELLETLYHSSYLDINYPNARLSEKGKLFYDSLAIEIID